MDDERRSGQRWDVMLDAVWDGKSGNYTARITDLSDGGCYMDSLGNVNMGETVNLKLQLPNGEWLELTGEVAHHTPPMGFGVRFPDLSPDQLATLRAFIEYLKDPTATGLIKQES
jgi:Tfp pilus assembly protein PilZ